MPILSTDASTALRRKTASSQVFVATTAATQIPMFIAPRALVIKSANLSPVILFAAAATVTLGNASSAATYATFPATGAAQAVGTVVAATTITGTVVPANTPVTVTYGSSGAAGQFIITIDWEPVEQDLLT